MAEVITGPSGGGDKPDLTAELDAAEAIVLHGATAETSEATELRERVRRQAAEIDHMRRVLERKNRDLDALHLVWCDGGCPSGVHRRQGEEILVTEELVAAAERNTARLRRWYKAVKFRFETYGPDPADPSRQFPSTASEWHRQRAMRAAARTDLPDHLDVPGER